MSRVWTATYPAAFGLAYVLLSFASFPTPTTDLLRPLAAVAVATTLVVIAAAAALRSLPRAALVVSVLVVAVSAPFLLVAVVAAAVVVVGWQLARRRWSMGTLRATSAAAASRAAGTFALAFLAVGVAVAAPSLASGWFTAESSLPSANPGARHPNIYLLLLDGYPRGDTLASVYSYDNSAFEAALGELGFSVADGSRSNYPQTPLTLASMFDGAYLGEIDGLEPPPESAAEQYRRLMSALNEASMPDLLRGAGYEIHTIPSPFQAVALSSADRILDTGQITAFEYSLLKHSQLAPLIVGLVPDFLMSQQRDRFHATLDRLVAEATANRSSPAFVFAHLFSPPHAPLVYGRDGEHLPLPDCVPATCELWAFPPAAWAHLPDQIHYTNGQVLNAVEEIVRNDPTGIVILMSDHGSRRDRSDLDEFFHIFFAARTPDREDFPDDVSPVNVMRLLVARETQHRLDPLPYRAWFFADERRPLELTPFAPTP